MSNSTILIPIGDEQAKAKQGSSASPTTFRFARYLYFPNDLACVIYNADARLLDRNVQSSKMVHAALLLLMLEAVFTDLVSPSA
jgi:hypothetical protein